MGKILVNGGRSLRGTVEISGMKNAALPILYACILVQDKCIIDNVPNVSDVTNSLELLRTMGAEISPLENNRVEIDCTNIVQGSAPYALARKMRASYYLFGAELGRFHKAYAPLPGGCDLGARPIDQHIKGFESLGGSVKIENGCIRIQAERLAGTHVYFDMVTVGATINVMLAAVLTPGVTLIDNPAKEPHIVDLANFLNTCGAHVRGAGTDMIKITGVERLHGCEYAIIPDMIEAGTYMLAAAATAGTVRINNVIPKHLESITAKLKEMNVTVYEDDDYLIVSSTGDICRTSIKTLPYPGFPTDMQPQMTALLCKANGVSTVSEGVFETRFRYVDELHRMGASISVEGRTAHVHGGVPLSPAPVRAVDLRAGAALVIAALMTEGETEISDVELIERGYDHLIEKFTRLGAVMRKIDD
ncbi:MAG: UDP-N-acetylglucosamine 1-carboxyvinyltransferase [Clostridia bacterium]|nr:UDP-N-acetylglucosamine 1-carboxyvinyltransferase [Clostridia bacterium]